ncbi:unnamed protein product, partial [Closterium sp. Naga37s-1]
PCRARASLAGHVPALPGAIGWRGAAQGEWAAPGGSGRHKGEWAAQGGVGGTGGSGRHRGGEGAAQGGVSGTGRRGGGTGGSGRHRGETRRYRGEWAAQGRVGSTGGEWAVQGGRWGGTGGRGQHGRVEEGTNPSFPGDTLLTQCHPLPSPAIPCHPLTPTSLHRLPPRATVLSCFFHATATSFPAFPVSPKPPLPSFPRSTHIPLAIPHLLPVRLPSQFLNSLPPRLAHPLSPLCSIHIALLPFSPLLRLVPH